MRIVSCASCGDTGQTPAPVVARERISAQSQESVKLEITTAEGDKVELSARSRDYLRASAGREGVQASQGSEFDVSVKVDGNLNGDEIADIKKLAEALAASVNDVQQGNLGKAAEDIQQVTDNSSIAQFRFQYDASSRYEKTVKAYQQGNSYAD